MRYSVMRDMRSWLAARVLFQLVAASALSRRSRSEGAAPTRERELAHHLRRHVDDPRRLRRQVDEQRLDHVAQFPDVARPVIRAERVHRARREPADRPAAAPGCSGAGNGRSGAGCRPARSRSGGSSTRHDVEAVVEILAEAARRRPRRSRSRLVAAIDAHVDLDARSCRRRAADRLALEHAQQLGLQSPGMSPISSRNSVPPCASSNMPALLPVGAGERAALVAEELVLEQRVGDRRRS